MNGWLTAFLIVIIFYGPIYLISVFLWMTFNSLPVIDDTVSDKKKTLYVVMGALPIAIIGAVAIYKT
jgi:hypothetical protein